nr:PREDICTED: uncharacterized protein LOC109039571 isoform X2 [Bemisia tabaci]
MDSISTTAAAADQLLVSNNIIKLEITDKSKQVSNTDNAVPPFIRTPETDAYANASHTHPSGYADLGGVSSNIIPDNPIANIDIDRLNYLETADESLEDSKPCLTDGTFINDLVPSRQELSSRKSRDGSRSSEQLPSEAPSVANSYLHNFNSCSLKDLPSGSTEADFGIVKEELHIEDIEEGAEYSCLSSQSSVTENLFANSLPESIEPFIKGNEAESLLKTDVRMNENASQENVSEMLDLFNKPVKPIRRQRVKKTPKIGARLSSVINKLAQSKETLIISTSNPSCSATATSESSFPSDAVNEACSGSHAAATQLDIQRSEISPANTASASTTVQSLSDAQVLSNSTNQCLDSSISKNCDEFSAPSNSISESSESLDKTKSSLVVDRLKRLGTSIEVEKPTTDALESTLEKRSGVASLNKSEPSITIEPQPFVTTRSLSQSLPTLRVPLTKSRTVKKTSGKPQDAEAPTVKCKSTETGVSSEGTKSATESKRSSAESTQPVLEPNDDISLLQYKNCLNMLETLVKADDLVTDITKNCIKNKTNRKINKNVLKYDSTLSKQNWKSNLVTNESSPSKTTLILNKKNPLKTKIKIVSNPVINTTQETDSVVEGAKNPATSQKIDGERVKIIMDKHNFTLGENSVLEMPNGSKMYTCDVCNGVYQKGFSLKRHYLRSHINNYFFCVKETETSGSLTFQLSGGADDNGGVDPSKALLFRCHFCGSCFSLKSELKGHLTAHPPVNSISTNDVKVYKCINCSIVFNKKKEFSKHRKTCVIEVPVAPPPVYAPKQRLNQKLLCLFCPKVFPSAVDRRKHGLKMHHPKKKVHGCFKCIEQFLSQANVYQHLREVHKSDYFSCSTCKERFANDLELKTHCQRKHNGNMDVLNSVSDKNGVIDWFEEPEEKLPELICNVCSKSFSSQSNLNKHTKTFHLLEKNDKNATSPKHVTILSKAGNPGKESKTSKTKIDPKKLNSKSKSDPKSKDQDMSFYSELSDNIQFNLMHHIDGKLQNEKKNAPPSSVEITSTVSPPPPPAKGDSPSKTQSLAQLDLVGKSSLNKGASTSSVQDEKPNDWYGNTLNYTEDMSHLDIATQLTMKRNLHILNSSRAKSEDTSQVCGNIRLKRVKDLSKDLSLERPETLCAESFGDRTFGMLESNAGLSGFWTRPHNYVCTTCGSQSLNFWDMEDHKWNSHPNVKCSHYEFTENHLPGWEFFTSRTFTSEDIDAIEPNVDLEVPSATNRSRCSKCKKTCSSTLELHRHMLECGLDTTWMLTLMPSPTKKQKEKKKWRPFGSRRRRMSRVRGFKRNIPNSPMKIILPPKVPLGKSKSGDTETIQKMIANLPAKRATRRVVIFDNPSRAGQATINCVPITSLNWNNNSYEDGLIENLLKNDQQSVPSESPLLSASADSINLNMAGKDCKEAISSPADLLSNSSSRTRIVPIWPPAEQSDVLTSLRMMPIPQIPMVVEAAHPVTLQKPSEPDMKPVLETVKPVKQLKPAKTTKHLRSLVRQLSASSLESSSESNKKPSIHSEKTSNGSSRSTSPGVNEPTAKVSGLILEKASNKTSSMPSSPSKVTLALSKFSVKKPSDLATEKSTILDAMRIAMATVNPEFTGKSLLLKSGKGNVLKKSLSESLLSSSNILRTETVCDNNPLSCVDCSKVFKNRALLRRHMSRCPVSKRIRSLNSTPNLTPGVSPTPGEIESLISSPVITPPKGQLPASTEISQIPSKRDTRTHPLESTIKSPSLRSRKPAKDNTLPLNSEGREKISKVLRSRTRKTISDLPPPEASEELILDEVTGELVPVDRPPKLKVKVSIMTRSERSNYVSPKVKSSSATETEPQVLTPKASREDITNVVNNDGSKMLDAAMNANIISATYTNGMFSDSDTDSTPLVQLKEILSAANKTGEKPQKKVLVKKKKVFRKRRTKAAKKKRLPSRGASEQIKYPGKIVVLSSSDSKESIQPLGSLITDKNEIVTSSENVPIRSKKSNSLKMQQRAAPNSKKRILRKRKCNSELENASESVKIVDEVPASTEALSRQEDEIKEEPNLDESFKLYISEEDVEAKEELELSTAGPSVDDKKESLDVIDSVSNHDEMLDADVSKLDTLSDAKSTSSIDEGPSKPKRKRRSAYNLLFTSLKQEDMNELLTTIQADRQNLKRKCTMVDSLPAIDKKVKRSGSKSDDESVDKLCHEEAVSQSNNSDLATANSEDITDTANTKVESNSDRKDKPSLMMKKSKLRKGGGKLTTDNTLSSSVDASAKVDDPVVLETPSGTIDSEGVQLGLSSGEKSATLKGRSLKKNPRSRATRVPETVKSQRQTLLDEFVEADTPSSSEISAGSASGSINTSSIKTRPKPSSNVTKSFVPPSDVQISSTRKNKNQKIDLNNPKTNLGSSEEKNLEERVLSRSASKLRSAVEAKNLKMDEVAVDIPEVEAVGSLVSSRTRARKLNPKMASIVPATESFENELDPATEEVAPRNTSADSSVNEDSVVRSKTGLSKSKNVPINAKTVNVEPGKKEEPKTSVNTKKRKQLKRGIGKDLLSEATSDDDNIPLSSLSAEKIASSLSTKVEDAELSDIDQVLMKRCQEPSASSLDLVNTDNLADFDKSEENPGGNSQSLLKVKSKSKNLKRKRRKEFGHVNSLNNVDSPMTSDSEGSILRVHKKQPKGKKSALANEVSCALAENDLLINSANLRKKLAKLKTTKDLKKVLSLIQKGGTAETDNEACDETLMENSQSNDPLFGSVIQRKKKLKKKKLKKRKKKNFKDKDLVNVLVQTVAKTANKLLTKKSAEQLRKKQLKLQRKKALEKLSHANNAWQISIVNPETKETSTTEIPDSSNDLEVKKGEELKALEEPGDIDSDNSSVNLSKSKGHLYCSVCDKSFLSAMNYNKHFTTWRHMFHEKLDSQQQDSDSPKISVNSSSVETNSVSSNTSISTSSNTSISTCVSNISLSSLKSKLNAATKCDETLSVTTETSSSVSTPPTVPQDPASTAIKTVALLSEVESSKEPQWTQPSWQMNPAPDVSVNNWYESAWPKTTSYESISLGSILDSVNQILSDPSSADPHSYPINQYSLADLQHAICASDEEMAILQHWGENCQTLSEPEYVYDNSAVQQPSHPPAFNEWSCESADLIDLDNQNSWSKKPTATVANSSDNQKSSHSGKVTLKPKPNKLELKYYEDFEMTCPTPSCSKRFHGISALRKHISWAHSNNKKAIAYCNPKTDLLTTCMTSQTVAKNLVCFVCKEICSSKTMLDSHVSTSHVRKKPTELVPGSSKTPLSEGAEKLKSKMSSAFGGLLDRALNNLKLNPQKVQSESGESSKPPVLPAISNETLKLLGQLKEKRRLETAESKTLTSNLAHELRNMLSRKRDDSPTTSEIAFSRRSSIDSDAEVSSTTVKTDYRRPFGCPLCSMTFASSVERNRHLTVNHGPRHRTVAPEPTPAKALEAPPEPDVCPAPERKSIPKECTNSKINRSKQLALDWKVEMETNAYEMQCDNCNTTINCPTIDNPSLESPKPKKPTKRITGKKNISEKESAASTSSVLDCSNMHTGEVLGSNGSTSKSRGSKVLPKKLSKPKTEALEDELEIKKAKEEEKIKRQNDAFDLLLGKKPSKGSSARKPKPKTKGKYIPKPDPCPATRKKAISQLQALGENTESLESLQVEELKMPALKPVKAPTRVPSRVSPDIPAPILKPITAEVPKLIERKTKPPALSLAVSPKTLKALKSIDTSSCDSDSCKLDSPSFDLPEIEPYSSGMIESPKTNEEEGVSLRKPNTLVKKTVAPQSKCDNVSELEQLFSDDDSDQETTNAKPSKETEKDVSPETLKSLNAFRETLKVMKTQGTSEPKNCEKTPSTADVYDFED